MSCVCISDEISRYADCPLPLRVNLGLGLMFSLSVTYVEIHATIGRFHEVCFEMYARWIIILTTGIHHSSGRSPLLPSDGDSS